MDGNRMTHAPSSGFERWATRWTMAWGKWTPRIVLWTLASVAGLWLGTSARPATVRGHAVQPSTRSQASIADVFRWDILLVGQESRAKRVQPVAPRPRQFALPAAVLCAQQQRPEPVPSVFPKTLSIGARPRFMFTLPGKPSGQMKWDEQVAHLEHTQYSLRAVLDTVPGLTSADRKSIQVEVNRACAQIGSLRKERTVEVAEPPEPPVDLPGDWPEPPHARVLP